MPIWRLFLLHNNFWENNVPEREGSGLQSVTCTLKQLSCACDRFHLFSAIFFPLTSSSATPTNMTFSVSATFSSFDPAARGGRADGKCTLGVVDRSQNVWYWDQAMTRGKWWRCIDGLMSDCTFYYLGVCSSCERVAGVNSQPSLGRTTEGDQIQMAAGCWRWYMEVG